MIHFFHRSHAKKPESGLFSDWIGNNTDDLRCSDWPKCRHPLVVVDFSLHFCLLRINEQSIHTRVRYALWNFCRLSFLEFEECLNRNIFHLIVYLKVAVKNSPIIWMQFDIGEKVTEATNGFTFQIMTNNQFMNGILTWFDGNSSFRNLRIILSDLRFHNTFQFVKYGASA